MKSIIDITLSIIFLTGGLKLAHEAIYKPIKRATIIKLHEGVPPLSPFTRKMTGWSGSN